MRAPASDTLQIPDWVPVPVQRHFLVCEELFGGGLLEGRLPDGIKSDLAILRRLTANSRMLYVWRELARGKATDKALVEFFDCAFQRARFPYFVTTPKDRAAQAAAWSSVAELCRWSHEHGIAARMRPELAAALVLVANHFEEVAHKEGNTDSPLVVKHHHNINDEARAYVRVLGGLTRKLFGIALYRTVATTASVALQQEISLQQVRDWLKP